MTGVAYLVYTYAEGIPCECFEILHFVNCET